MDAIPVLITGGAGYIGSHAVLAFLEAGHQVVVLDNLSTGVRAAVSGEAVFVEGDAGDQVLVGEIIRRHGIGAAIHFAGSIDVAESVVDPLKYYRNNSCVSLNLIQACIEGGVESFIFSSSAAVYGNRDAMPARDNTTTRPINPYGSSKLVTEWTLREAAAAHDFRYVALRYFNVAGADPARRVGQYSPNATHLIKVACECAIGRRPHVEIFGEDYDTPDGTCIRDYIHVTDLASAHLYALRYLRQGGESTILDCGYGRGYSVREVLAAVQSESDRQLDIRTAGRRPGDPPVLIADPGEIRATLGWQPRHDDLNFIVRTALAWERQLPNRRS